MTKTWDLILTGTKGRLGYDDGNGHGDGLANGEGDGTGDGGGDSTGDGSGYGRCGWVWGSEVDGGPRDTLGNGSGGGYGEVRRAS